MEVSSSRPRPLAPGQLRAPRRVATAPVALPSSNKSLSSSPEPAVETLYSHHNVKIVAFTATPNPVLPTDGIPHVADGALVGDHGSLSWSSRVERTIAVGAFSIYRAPGSVAFLSCGPALQPILPKSQSWCLDEANSKYVLQIRKPNYWRVEVPIDRPEDEQRALALRSVLDNISQFEKTACPFARSFRVDIPAPPSEPTIRKPWRPVKRSSSGGPPEECVSIAPVSFKPLPPQKARLWLDGDPSANWIPFRKEEGASIEDPVSPPRPTNAAREEPNFALRREKFEGLSAGPDVLSSRRASIPRNAAEVTDADLLAYTMESFSTPVEEVAESLAENLVPDHTENAEVDKGGALDRLESSQHASSVLEGGIESGHDASGQLRGLDEPRGQVTILTSRSSSDSSEANEASVALPPVSHIHEGEGNHGRLMKARLRRTAGFKYSLTRAVTSPPQLTVVTSPPSKSSRRDISPRRTSTSRDVSPSGSQDSFHSVQSWHSPITPLPPSPPMSQPESPATFPYPHNNIARPRGDALGGRQSSNATVIQRSGNGWETLSSNGSAGSEVSSVPNPPERYSTPTIESPDGHDPASLSVAASSALEARDLMLRQRARLEDGVSLRRRALSPMPPASTIFSPDAAAESTLGYRTRLGSVKRLPQAIISKTCEILLGPPLHLVALMLRVAAKIVAGEWRGQAYGYDDSGQPIPVQWDYSEGDFSDWSDDGGSAG